MSNRLDHLLARLRVEPLDRSLVNIEAEVHRAISGRAPGFGVSVLAPLRAATVVAGLVTGVAIGGMTAATAMAAPKVSPISAGEELAPSTLLEGR